MTEETITVTRKELYERVWAIPTATLARELGLSDTGLAKLCLRNNIPRPRRGDWAKMREGHKVRQPKLPYEDDDAEITIKPTRWSRRKAALEPRHEYVDVPKTLRGAHPLVSTALEVLEQAKRNSKGMLERPIRNCLDVAVTKRLLRRALRIMDAIIKECESRGWTCKIDNGETVVQTADARVVFGISEILEYRESEKHGADISEGRKFHRRYEQKTEPTGKLMLKIKRRWSYGGDGYRRTWSDGKLRQVGDSLHQFIETVEKIALDAREAAIERERQEREWEEEKRREEELEQIRAEKWEQVQAEQTRVDNLKASAADWAESNRLRSYIDAVENVHGEKVPPEWYTWARDQAERLDPLKESPPSILDDAAQYQPQ